MLLLEAGPTFVKEVAPENPCFSLVHEMEGTQPPRCVDRQGAQEGEGVGRAECVRGGPTLQPRARDGGTQPPRLGGWEKAGDGSREGWVMKERKRVREG